MNQEIKDVLIREVVKTDIQKISDYFGLIDKAYHVIQEQKANIENIETDLEAREKSLAQILKAQKLQLWYINLLKEKKEAANATIEQSKRNILSWKNEINKLIKSREERIKLYSEGID